MHIWTVQSELIFSLNYYMDHHRIRLFALCFIENHKRVQLPMRSMSLSMNYSRKDYFVLDIMFYWNHSYSIHRYFEGLRSSWNYEVHRGRGRSLHTRAVLGWMWQDSIWKGKQWPTLRSLFTFICTWCIDKVSISLSLCPTISILHARGKFCGGHKIPSKRTHYSFVLTVFAVGEFDLMVQIMQIAWKSIWSDFLFFSFLFDYFTFIVSVLERFHFSFRIEPLESLNMYGYEDLVCHMNLYGHLYNLLKRKIAWFFC